MRREENKMGREPRVPPVGRPLTEKSARVARKRNGKAPANGTELYFACAGVASGLPLVLIPETGTDRRIWGDQVRAFAQHYQVVRYDLRGWGRSRRQMGIYRHAEDLAGLLDWLGIERAALVGVYSGANIALELALERPERVAALVLVQPRVDGWLPHAFTAAFDLQVEHLMAAAAQPNPATRVVRMVGVARAIDRQAYVPDAQPRRTWRRRWATLRQWAILLENLPRTLAMDYGGPYTDWRHLRAVDPQDLDPEAPSYNPRRHRGPDVWACLEQISAPTLVVRGAPVPSLAQEHDKEFLARLAGAEVAVVADAPRLPHMIQPDAFNRIVLDFLQRMYPPR